MSFSINEAFDTSGYIQADRIVDDLHITKKEFALAVGLSAESLMKIRRLRSTKTQMRLRQTLEILNRIEPWAGSLGAAWSWYRSQAIPALGDLTAEELVARGQAEDVRAYLSHIGEGGYA